MKKIILISIMFVSAFAVSCSNDSDEQPPVVTEDCDCYTQTLKINSSNDTIFKSEKMYGQNLGTCGQLTRIIIPESPFLDSHYITNCDLD